jgi:hypothetical protein
MKPDPITTHVAALERALRGPRRTRRSMIAEARAGLRDAEAAYRDGGYPADQAAAWAVRDFGTVSEIAPEFQDELTARRARWSALLFALVFPGMMLAWDLFWSVGTTHHAAGPASPMVRLLSSAEDVATLVIGAAALALLAFTFRRTVPVHRLTRAIGLTGVAGALLCAGLALAMNAAGTPTASEYVLTAPAAISAYTGSAVVMVLLIWQSVRTLRAARAAAPSWPALEPSTVGV